MTPTPAPTTTRPTNVHDASVDRGDFLPIVTDLPADRVVPAEQPPRPWRVPHLHELLALATTLQEAGYDVGITIAKVEALATEVDRELDRSPSSYLNGADLLDTPAEVIAQRIREDALSVAARDQFARAREDLNVALARSAVAAFHTASDAIVAKMRPPFRSALKVIQRAADVGLIPDTQAEELAATGTPEAIAAFRKLDPAVAQLDALARLRTQMAQVARIGPHDHPVASLLATVDHEHPLSSAEGIWRGTIETVQYNLPPYGGPIRTQLRRARVGGVWLDLIVRGYKPGIATAAEAQAHVAAETER